jgi:hypothetical protein
VCIGERAIDILCSATNARSQIWLRSTSGHGYKAGAMHEAMADIEVCDP